MAIKKIKFDMVAYSRYMVLYRLKFWTKIDGVWAVYPIGTKVSSLETSKLILKPSIAIYDDDLYKKLFTDTNPGDFRTVTSSNKMSITVTFKEPLDVLQKITYCTFDAGVDRLTSLKITVYDTDDVTIFSGSAAISSVENTTTTCVTPDLEYMRTYAVNRPSFVETTDINQLTDVFSVRKVSITCNELTDTTFCKFLLSFDQRSTYKYYDKGSDSWIVCSKDDIMKNGMTKDFFEATAYKYIASALDPDNPTVDTLVGLMTTDAAKTPSIQQIIYDYLKIKK